MQLSSKRRPHLSGRDRRIRHVQIPGALGRIYAARCCLGCPLQVPRARCQRPGRQVAGLHRIRVAGLHEIHASAELGTAAWLTLTGAGSANPAGGQRRRHQIQARRHPLRRFRALWGFLFAGMWGFLDERARKADIRSRARPAPAGNLQVTASSRTDSNGCNYEVTCRRRRKQDVAGRDCRARRL